MTKATDSDSEVSGRLRRDPLQGSGGSALSTENRKAKRATADAPNGAATAIWLVWRQALVVSRKQRRVQCL